MLDAFLLQVHKDSEQLRELISVLSENADVYIHMDGKSKSDYQTLNWWLQNNKFYGVVELISEIVNVYWGHCSQVITTFNLLKYSFKKRNYLSYTLLSGECFPIKPVRFFIDFLRLNESSNFMCAREGECFRNRIGQYHFFIDNDYYRKSILLRAISVLMSKLCSFLKIKNKIFDSYPVYKGSSWFTFSRHFVEYLINKIDDESLLDKIKYSICIDEVFFQTILLNSPFRNSHVNDNLRLIKWNGGNSPIYLDENENFDLKNVFFARKINFSKNKILRKKIMDAISG